MLRAMTRQEQQRLPVKVATADRCRGGAVGGVDLAGLAQLKTLELGQTGAADDGDDLGGQVGFGLAPGCSRLQAPSTMSVIPPATSRQTWRADIPSFVFMVSLLFLPVLPEPAGDRTAGRTDCVRFARSGGAARSTGH